MRRLLPVLGLVLLLAACKPKTAADVPTVDTSGSSAAAPADSSTRADKTDSAPAPAAPQLAMAYHYGLMLPAAQVRPMMESHQEACERAGSQQCQVLGAAAKTEGKDRSEAQLTLRATPAWMRVFRGRAEADVKDVGGRIADSGTTGEDLAAPIVDIEAAQRARAAERDRLQGLMARRTKNLQDTLAVEQEITRVQGEMDKAQSELALMNGRVAMQTVTVDYSSLGLIAPDGVAAPVAQASQAFLGHMMGVFAALLTLASYLLPFALVAAPVIWLIARREKKAPAPTA